MLRLFVGIMLPPAQRLSLSRICLGLHGAKWVDPGNLHVTIRFIGEVDDGTAADIDAALARLRMPGFPLSVAGIGLFGPDDRPRTLYAGVERSEPLLRLHERVEHALMRLRLPPEGRRFTPHVTLARFQGPRAEEVRRFAAANALFRLDPFPVESFHLVVSHLTKSGSVYEDAAAYPLSGSA